LVEFIDDAHTAQPREFDEAREVRGRVALTLAEGAGPQVLEGRGHLDAEAVAVEDVEEA
jgi:hypothetical protein